MRILVKIRVSILDFVRVCRNFSEMWCEIGFKISGFGVKGFQLPILRFRVLSDRFQILQKVSRVPFEIVNGYFYNYKFAGIYAMVDTFWVINQR